MKSQLKLKALPEEQEIRLKARQGDDKVDAQRYVVFLRGWEFRV